MLGIAFTIAGAHDILVDTSRPYGVTTVSDSMLSKIDTLMLVANVSFS